VLLLPLIAAGMVANDRRLVWVQVLLALGAFILMSRRTRFKQFVLRCFLLSLPLMAAYVAIGWNAQSELFSPIKTFRSVGDSEVDASTLYRDLENYNLLRTLRYNIILGSGFGHPFAEEVPLPDISFFHEYRYMPHNSILGLWAFCGPFGFTGLSAVFAVAMFLAARSYRMAQVPDERVAAFMVIGTIVIYLIHCWGDIGFSERRSYVLVGPVIAIAGQLALSTGAWRLRPKRHAVVAGRQ
jgi:O-antigen ligase